MDIQDIVDLHGKLAKRIKQFETSLDVYPPTEVSNEIRYALRASVELLELINNGETENKDGVDHVVQKIFHALICAYHDLVDGLVLHLAVTLDEFREEYLEESILILGDRRTELIDFIHKVNDKIAISREQPRERKKIYEEVLYDEYFTKLIDYRRLLTGPVMMDVVKLHLKNKVEKEKQETIRKEEEQQRREDRLERVKNRHRFILTTVLTIIGIAIAWFMSSSPATP